MGMGPTVSAKCSTEGRIEMSSRKQRKANRANALKSTGPKTPEGKARSSMNALKHGLTSSIYVLPSEDPMEWESMLQSGKKSFCCIDSIQELMVERIVSGFWRLRRITHIETNLMAHQMEKALKAANPDDDGADETKELKFFGFSGTPEDLSILSRYETSLDRGIVRNMKMLEQLRRNIVKRDVEEVNKLLGFDPKKGFVNPPAMKMQPSRRTVQTKNNMMAQTHPMQPATHPMAPPPNFHPSQLPPLPPVPAQMTSDEFEQFIHDYINKVPPSCMVHGKPFGTGRLTAGRNPNLPEGFEEMKARCRMQAEASDDDFDEDDFDEDELEEEMEERAGL